MVSISEILNGIHQMITAKIPNTTVYIHRCPEALIRPAFLLEHIRTTKSDSSRNTVEKASYCTVTCFEEVDDHQMADPEKLIAMQEKLMDSLEGGTIRVGDRVIRVQSSTGGMESDRAYVELQFQYFDDRVVEDTTDTPPLIDSLHMRYRKI